MNPSAPARRPGAAEPGTVYLCGAGPGAPDLLTLRAARLLETAQIILPDDLVSPEILALANPAAEVIPVGKRCGQPRITQGGIHQLMIEHARRPRSVLRLKSGDPLVFGRIGEEIDALSAAAIPFEIVPGITAAFAVASALRTPLTDRTASSRLVMATAHHSAVASDRETRPLLLNPYDPDATLVLYMPGRDFTRLAADLLRAGFPPETPVAAVSRASTPYEQVTGTRISGLPGLDPGPAPVILLIGQAIRIR